MGMVRCKRGILSPNNSNVNIICIIKPFSFYFHYFLNTLQKCGMQTFQRINAPLADRILMSNAVILNILSKYRKLKLTAQSTNGTPVPLFLKILNLKRNSLKINFDHGSSYTKRKL